MPRPSESGAGEIYDENSDDAKREKKTREANELMNNALLDKFFDQGDGRIRGHYLVVKDGKVLRAYIYHDKDGRNAEVAETEEITQDRWQRDFSRNLELLQEMNDIILGKK